MLVVGLSKLELHIFSSDLKGLGVSGYAMGNDAGSIAGSNKEF